MIFLTTVIQLEQSVTHSPYETGFILLSDIGVSDTAANARKFPITGKRDEMSSGRSVSV